MEALCQFRARWREGEIPRIVADQAEAYHRRHREVADRLAAEGGPVAFEPPPIETDPETFEAVRAWHEDGVPMSARPDGVSFAESLPLLLEHVGAPIGEVEGIAQGEDDVFSVIGWVDARYRDELLARPSCSPGSRIVKARIVELAPGMRVAEAYATTLYELSVVAEPVRSDTVLMVGEPGVTEWAMPLGKRYMRWTPRILATAGAGRP